MKAHVHRLEANLRNLTPSQREEVLGSLRALIDQYAS